MIDRKCFRFKLPFFILLILLQHTSVAASFDVERNYQIILKHLNLQYPAGNVDKQLLELDALKIEVDEDLAKDPKNPFYWFFKGAYSFSYIYAYSRQLKEINKELSKEEMVKRREAFQKKRKTLSNDATRSFAKALELDSEENPTLTMGMLDLMRSFGGHEVAIKALRRIYARMDYDPNDFNQYDTRSAIVSRFVALGRFDEAEEELQQIKTAMARAG